MQILVQLNMQCLLENDFWNAHVLGKDLNCQETFYSSESSIVMQLILFSLDETN